MLKLYFPHDQNARNDPAIVKLRRKYGWEGYGIYFAIIEILHEQQGQIAQDDLDDIRYALNIENVEFFNNVITMLYQVKLLVITDGFLKSDRVLENLKLAEEKRTKRSRAGKKGMRSRWSPDKDGKDRLEKMKENAGLR